MNYGELYEFLIGILCVVTGGYLMLEMWGFLPRKPTNQQEMETELWRKKYRLAVLWAGPIVVLYGMSSVVSFFL